MDSGVWKDFLCDHWVRKWNSEQWETEKMEGKMQNIDYIP